MAGIKKGGLSGSRDSEYSVIYSNLGGVDLSSDGSGISRKRFAYAENMYKDYEGEGGDAVESVPGFRRLASLGGKIKKIFISKPDGDEEYLAIHAGESLYLSSKEALLRGDAPIRAVDGISGISPSGGDITAVSFGAQTFFFGGKRILSLGKGGVLKEISEAEDGIYIPFTYVNGIESEQRNMLTRLCCESFSVGSAYKYSFGTASLTYQVTDFSAKTCRVTGISDSTEKRVYIPNRIKLADEYYSVTEVASHAFSGNTEIRTVEIAEGVKSLGKFAFADCTALASVILPDTVEFIDNACFARCTALIELHLGLGLKEIGASPLAQCISLDVISYASDESDFKKIENVSLISGFEVRYGEKRRSGYLSIPVFGPVIEINRVTADGEELEFTPIKRTSRLIGAVKIFAEDISALDGKEFIIEATASSYKQDYGEYRGYMNSTYATFSDTKRLISLCSLSTVYDGRIFLGGNERHPSLLFYNTRDRFGEINPLYFGEYDYIDVVGERITRLITVQSSLAVYTSTGGGCAISYLSGKDTGIDLTPRIYPTEYIHSGLSEAYAATSFLDDQHFLSREGLIRIEKLGTNLERSLSVISGKVNKSLLSTDLNGACMAVWLGYLAIGAKGKIFLADPRQAYYEDRVLQYEWYLLSDIGTYENDFWRFKYSSVGDGFSEASSELSDREVPSDVTVYSGVREDGTVGYYVKDGEKRICVHKTGELYGGEFSPLCTLASDGSLLYFGTESGDICVFNNDKRGIAPSAYSQEESDVKDYERRFGRSIAREYYSFAGHRPKYILKLKRDDCGIPHLTKSTVKHSMTLRLRSASGGRISCEIKTDRGVIKEALLCPSGSLCFDGIDFSDFSFDSSDSFTTPLSEKERGWVEKQITVSSAEFASPIAIYNLAYRFRVKGKIKKN